MEVDIGKEFSPYPFGRYQTDGPFNGERFREELLKPAYLKSLETEENLVINFKKVKWAIGSSFLSECFEEFAKDDVVDTRVLLEKLEIQEHESTNGFYKNTITGYIRDVQNGSSSKSAGN